ncbi:MAG: methyltransferase domain-containing protein [Bacteroidota bacterium]
MESRIESELDELNWTSVTRCRYLLGKYVMNACCNNPASCEPANKFFTKWSKRYAKRFRKEGLEKTQRYLLEGVRKEAVASKEILDIGCGIGSLHMTLLLEGAASATAIDVSDGMLQQAKALAKENRMEKQTNYILGDFVSESGMIKQADITMMDKVVCCYEDYNTLITTSAAKTKTIYAVTHPKKNIIMELLFKLQIFILKLFRNSFYPFWHDWNEVHRIILGQGFRLIYSNSTIAWQVLVYKRISSPI